MRSMIIDVNDGTTLQILYNRFSERISFMSVSLNASRYSDRLDNRRFVLEMCFHGLSFMTRDGSAQTLKAADG